MSACVAGAALLLCLVASGARSLAARSGGVSRVAPYAKKIAGAAFLLVGVLMITGLDKQIESRVLDLLPNWLIIFTTKF